MACSGAANLYAGINLKNQRRVVTGIGSLMLAVIAAPASICNMF